MISLLLQITPEIRPSDNLAEPWLTGVLFGCLALVALVNASNRNRVLRLLASVVNIRVLQEWYRDQQEALRGGAYPLVVVYVMTLSVLLFIGRTVSGFPIRALDFVSILAVVALVFGVKNLALRAVYDITDGRFGLALYRFEYVVLAQVQALALLPLVIVATYVGMAASGVFVWLGLGLVGTLYLFRLVRGIAHALRLRVPAFYIIFYLCALEFLPLAALVRVVLR